MQYISSSLKFSTCRSNIFDMGRAVASTTPVMTGEISPSAIRPSLLNVWNTDEDRNTMETEAKVKCKVWGSKAKSREGRHRCWTVTLSEDKGLGEDKSTVETKAKVKCTAQVKAKSQVITAKSNNR